MRVVDIGGAERGFERVGVELRNMSGLRDGAHVSKMTNAVRIQQRDELFNRVSGVADGEEDSLQHYSIVMRKNDRSCPPMIE
jgi:hypothetical protein